MSEHSPEAIAAYDGQAHSNPGDAWMDGFDAGRAVTLAVTREALAKIIDSEVDSLPMEWWAEGGSLRTDGLPMVLADAILAAGVLRDERTVKAEALVEAANARYRHGASSGQMVPSIRAILTKRAEEILAGITK